VLAAAGMTAAQVDWLIPHQANVRILQATAKSGFMPMERCIVTVAPRQHLGGVDSAGARRGGARRPHPARPAPAAGRRRRRLHLGRDPAPLLNSRMKTDMKFALVFPGQGSQSLGMMAAYGDSP
jgi:hypothetical protein